MCIRDRYKVVTVADYKARTKTDVATGKTEPIELPAANVLKMCIRDS